MNKKKELIFFETSRLRRDDTIIFFSLTQFSFPSHKKLVYTNNFFCLAKGTMVLSTKSLKVIEKFRAPAALYIPSKIKGGGWAEVSRPGMGGEAIIQVQDDATMSGKRVSVVRFLMRHGKDLVNARIMKGLPIIRNSTDEKSVVFMSASTSTTGTRQKTMFNLIFTNVEDADEFLMWWYAKNGSIKAWLAKETSNGKAAEPSKKPLGESTNQKSIDEASAKMRLCNLKTSDNKKYSPAFGNNNGSRNDGSSSDGSDDSDEVEEVEIDWDEAPQTQDWASSFSYDAA